MPDKSFTRIVLESTTRLALPIATYPGLALTGDTVSDIVTSPDAQFRAQVALRERHGSPFVLSAMDLSAEAEAFGATVALSDHEIPTVTGRLIVDAEQAARLAIPQPGEGRTQVSLETVRQLAKLPGAPFVFAGCIGPFSLAARLVGVSEALEMTATEPELMHTLLEKSTAFLAAYIAAFRAAGANGVIMAEPAAGLLSPKSLSAYSSKYVRQIAAGFAEDSFTIILHNCAAKLLHLPAIQESGLKTFHFGAPMDLVSALSQVPADTVICGNLDPAAVFVQLPAAGVAGKIESLLQATTLHKNFVLSSGCDVPPNAPLANLDAFYQAVASWNESRRHPAPTPTAAALRPMDNRG
jgi:uroporphyrinogen decarboxylase